MAMLQSFYTSREDAAKMLQENGYERVLNFDNQCIETSVFENKSGAIVRILYKKLDRVLESNTLVQFCENYKSAENCFCQTIAYQIASR